MLRYPLRSGFVPRHAAPVVFVAMLAGCATRPAAAPAATTATIAPTWPAIPRAEGPLAIRVQYPSPNAVIAARDSTFLLGTVSHGGATLAINGATVQVRPNGAFLAWVAMPPRRTPQFELVATVPGAEPQRLVLPIRLPAERASVDATRPPFVDTTSITPRGGLALRGDEPVRVSARLASGARAELRPTACPGANPATTLQLLASEASETVAREVPARLLRCGGAVAVFARDDTTAYLRPVPNIMDGDSLGFVRVGTAVADTDAVVIARPIPNGTYKWFLIPGTVLRATGRQGDQLRVQLDAHLDVWVDASAATPLTEGTAVPRRVVSNARLVPNTDYVDLVLPMSARPAYRVEAEGSTLRLTLHGVTGNTDIAWFQRSDSLVRDLQWTNEASDRAVYTLRLRHDVYGWLGFWRGDAFVLRVRRAPVIDSASPLRGLRIAVDPGHPPIGSTGPTGLYEGVATLAIGERVQRLLTARGATPIMTRTTAAAVPLGERPVMARRADAQAFVSIHLNAKPDGVNPYLNNGSGTYYFQPQSAGLARAIQSRLLVRLGLPDEGTWFDNLAVVRGTWMPSVLVEGAYVIVPEQEAALRTPEFQEAYALAVVEGLEAWFRGLAVSAARP
ncbi:MAG TPA: N-acetylmuramoyl-L-alanine amidase [Gemmatimonadaceae bacterium]|nr:N-acetylmuramoyl-L-alanine amidase [Gemmatimonadaceae bacterium]